MMVLLSVTACGGGAAAAADSFDVECASLALACAASVAIIVEAA